jgi:glycosyltransferase involved in cell wall biosynthesis
MKRLAIIATHPVQYFAPLFRLLTERGRITIKVFYTFEKGSAAYDKDFGKEIAWDIPMLDGYAYEFVSNGGSSRRDFRGVKNPGLEKAIEAWGAEAVLVIGWNYRSHLRAMCYFKRRIPVLFRGDSTLLDEQKNWKKMVRRLFLRWVYRHVDIALYVGSRNKDYFLIHGLKERQLVFAPHAVENERFFDTTGEYTARAEARRAALGVSPQDLLIVFVGKFQEKKDPVLLAKAWKQIGERDVHLLLAGDGELERSLRETACQDSRVHFLPFQNQSVMPEVYRIGDVFCLPSKGPGETWGLAVNEAMACSRPVLTSDRCGCSVDLVHNGVNGFTFAAGNQDELCARIRWFREQRDRLKEMGTASASLIRSWSFAELAAAMEKTV